MNVITNFSEGPWWRARSVLVTGCAHEPAIPGAVRRSHAPLRVDLPFPFFLRAVFVLASGRGSARVSRFGGFRATRLEPTGTGPRARMVASPRGLGATRSRRLRAPPSHLHDEADRQQLAACPRRTRTRCELARRRGARGRARDAWQQSSGVRSAWGAVGRGGSAEEAYARSPETTGHRHHPRAGPGARWLRA